MALQTTGPISLQDLKNEFTSSNPVNIDDYYRRGDLVPDISINNSVPTSGKIDLNDFYGAVRHYPTDVYPSSLSYNGSGGSKNVTVEATEPWSLTYPLWIEASRNSADWGTTSTTLTLGANPEGTDRNIMIYINTSKDSTPVNITQTANPDTLDLDPSSKTISDGNADTYTISVTTNTTYTVQSDAAWAEADILNGIRVRVSQNDTGATRWATITATTPNSRVESHVLRQDEYIAPTSYAHFNISYHSSESQACEPTQSTQTLYTASDANWAFLSGQLFIDPDLSQPVGTAGYYLKGGVYHQVSALGYIQGNGITCNTGTF